MHVVLMCISLILNIWRYFYMLRAISVFSIFTMEFLILCHLILKYSLYIRDISRLSMIYVANIFSSFFSCLLTIVFGIKSFIFMHSNLSIVYFILYQLFLVLVS